jgi:ADP-L-glycero-D-manno-heptose 6-epimerase
MIIVTGAAGFIGSNVVADLEEAGRHRICACDWFGMDDKWRNLAKHRISAFVTPEDLPDFIDANRKEIAGIVHMGAISATTERDVDQLIKLNINFSVMLWRKCTEYQIPYIYASSAATYGAAENDLFDDESLEAIDALRPLNAYGWSKKATDQIFLTEIADGKQAPPQWIGLKFFNVYGPNEYHKGDMKSVIAKLFPAVRDGETVRLFKSDRAGIADGQQMRDFVYVKDCTRVIAWLLDHPEVSGIFNIGTGKARSFADLAKSIGLAMDREVDIEFIEMPNHLKGKYQYFTQAEMEKLRRLGMNFDFHSLEEGVADYVNSHLATDDPYR